MSCATCTGQPLPCCLRGCARPLCRSPPRSLPRCWRWTRLTLSRRSSCTSTARRRGQRLSARRCRRLPAEACTACAAGALEASQPASRLSLVLPSAPQPLGRLLRRHVHRAALVEPWPGNSACTHAGLALLCGGHFGHHACHPRPHLHCRLWHCGRHRDGSAGSGHQGAALQHGEHAHPAAAAHGRLARLGRRGCCVGFHRAACAPWCSNACCSSVCQA